MIDLIHTDPVLRAETVDLLMECGAAIKAQHLSPFILVSLVCVYTIGVGDALSQNPWLLR